MDQVQFPSDYKNEMGSDPITDHYKFGVTRDAPPLAGITVVDLTRVLGEHTRRVLEQDLQVPPAEIDALEREGVIGCR